MAPRKEDPAPEAPAPTENTTPGGGRFSRFAKLGTLTAGTAARHLTQKVMSTFQNAQTAEEREKAALEKTARQMVKTLGELKGAAMKVGQMLTTDPELPPEMLQILSTLQSSAPAMSSEMVRRVVAEALGGKLEDHFTEFHDVPLGAASIGQVHRATTREGQAVAVKVQYPGIAETIRHDMRNLDAVMNVARAMLPRERVDAYLEELTVVLDRESDYVQEAQHMVRYGELLRRMHGVRAPEPVVSLTRTNVLTMEFVEGVRLQDWLGTASAEAARDMGLRLLRVHVDMLYRHHLLHADPHPGNFLVDTAGNLVVLDFGCVREYEPAFVDDMVRLLLALWRHDLDELQAAWRTLKFIDNGVDPDLVYEWFNLILAPLVHNGEFDFRAWKVRDDVMAFVMANPRIKLFAPPREMLFYMRVVTGLRGVLAQAGVTANLRRWAREVAELRGLV
ncbi:MAG: AarF/ABC1/UbiB kinase family protein [Myxococcota bacterium]